MLCWGLLLRGLFPPFFFWLLFPYLADHLSKYFLARAASGLPSAKPERAASCPRPFRAAFLA